MTVEGDEKVVMLLYWSDDGSLSENILYIRGSCSRISERSLVGSVSAVVILGNLKMFYRTVEKFLINGHKLPGRRFRAESISVVVVLRASEHLLPTSPF